MKTPSDDLFELIKTLDKSQKGYFKKYASTITADPANYLKLFVEIEKQKVYDENKIKKIFAKEKFAKQLSVTKNYLYELILVSLEMYKTDSDSQLLSLFRHASILFDLGLVDQSKKIIKKGRKLAEHKEKFIIQMLFLRLQWSIAFKERNDEALEENDALFSDYTVLLNKQHNAIAYHFEYFRFFTESQRMGITQDGKKLQRLEELIQSPLMANIDKAESITAKSSYLKTHSTFAFSKRSVQTLYEYNKELMMLIEHNPSVFDATFSYMSNMYSNLANSTLAMFSFEECTHWIKKLEDLEPINTNEKARKYEAVTQLRLAYSLRSGHYTKGVDDVRKMAADFDHFPVNDPVVKSLLIPASAAYIEFGAGNYKEALKWLNRILNNSEINLRNDIESAIRILDLVIHYELGHEDLLEHKIVSTYRYLAKKATLFDLEKQMMTSFKKLVEVDSEKKKMLFFASLKSDLERIAGEKRDLQLLEMFDVISWLESKLTGDSFENIMQKEYKKRFMKTSPNN